MRLLEKDQQIADEARLAVGDERSLQRQPLGIRHASEPTNLKAAQDPSSPDAV
jgi:hypothetical protein